MLVYILLTSVSFARFLIYLNLIKNHKDKTFQKIKKLKPLCSNYPNCLFMGFIGFLLNSHKKYFLKNKRGGWEFIIIIVLGGWGVWAWSEIQSNLSYSRKWSSPHVWVVNIFCHQVYFWLLFFTTYWTLWSNLLLFVFII